MAWCVVVLWFTHTSTVGGSAETEHTAVAVMPNRRPSRQLVMMLTAPASWRMPSLNCAALVSLSMRGILQSGSVYRSSQGARHAGARIFPPGAGLPRRRRDHGAAVQAPRPRFGAGLPRRRHRHRPLGPQARVGARDDPALRRVRRGDAEIGRAHV